MSPSGCNAPRSKLTIGQSTFGINPSIVVSTPLELLELFFPQARYPWTFHGNDLV
jgi:hypothetical protein